MDMIYNLKGKSYDTFVVLKSVGKNVLVELVIEVDQLEEEKPEIITTAYKEIFDKYPDNCGDNIKVCQELIIVGCSTNGATNIFKRDEMTNLVAKSSKGTITNYKIAVIEHNTNLNKIGAQKLENDKTTWMKKYLGTT